MTMAEIQAPVCCDSLNVPTGRDAETTSPVRSDAPAQPRRQVPPGLVRALPIEVQLQLPIDVVQVPLAHDHELVQTIPLHGLDVPRNIRPHNQRARVCSASTAPVRSH